MVSIHTVNTSTFLREMYIHIYISIYIYTHAHIHIHMHTHIYYVCIRTYIMFVLHVLNPTLTTSKPTKTFFMVVTEV